LTRILSELADAGVAHVNISGGEPLTHPDVLEILACAKSYGLAVGLYTNAVESATRLAHLLDSSTDYVHVSFDGVSQTAFTRQRGLDYREALRANVQHMVAEGLKVRLHMTVSDANVDELVDTYEEAQRLGVWTFSFTPIIGINRGKKFGKKLDSLKYFLYAFEIRRRQLVDGGKHVRVFMQPHVLLTGLEALFGDDLDEMLEPISLRAEPVYDVFTTCCTNADMTVILAPSIERDPCLGSLADEEFRVIWQRSHSFRQSLFNRDFRGSRCETCRYLSICQGGDWVDAYNRTGTTGGPGHGCFAELRTCQDHLLSV